MRKEIIIILLVIISILNIIAAAFIYFDIQMMQAPEVVIEIDVLELSSENIILYSIIEIDNPNDFEIITQNLELIITSPDGYEITRVFIEGGKINSNQKKNFSKEIILSFNENGPGLIKTKITGEFGANFWFIKKTIPINIGIITNIENLIDKLAAPNVDITIDFIEVTTKGVNISALFNIFNPNSFDIFIKDISVEVVTENGKKAGNVNVYGGHVPANNYLKINGSGSIFFEALNAKKLIFSITGIAGGKIAGFEKNLPFDIIIDFNIPDLEEIILSKDVPTILSIILDERLTLRGFVFDVGIEICNNYKIDLTFKDLTFSIYSVIDDTYQLIGKTDYIEEIYIKAGKSEISSCEIIIPYLKILSLYWSTDSIMVSVTGNVTISGVNQSIYLEIRGYQSIHPFR